MTQSLVEVPCRVCEAAHGRPLPPTMAVSASGLLHVVDDNGATLCGHRADGWERRDADG